MKRKGRSGVEHQIDVLAEYQCPLHKSKLVIEAKAYKSPIDKDRIMKLIQIVDDIGATTGIIVTTSYFTFDAIRTAEKHNIELWDREHLTKILGELSLTSTDLSIIQPIDFCSRLVVKSHLTTKEVESLMKRELEERAKGGFLGVGKIIERLDSANLQYHPYYEAEIKCAIQEEEKMDGLAKGLSRKSSKSE